MPVRCLTVTLALLLPALLALVLSLGAQGPAAPENLPPLPQGVEVQARGPVHEAFASLAGEPAPTLLLDRKPPRSLDEMPPAEKPAGNVVWISGYWAWDDDRKDYLWVSGVWRTPPPGKKWIPGYWREQEEKWQWVPGFWTTLTVAAAPLPPPVPGAPAAPAPLTAPAGGGIEEVTYLPQPPAPPALAPLGEPPQPDTFFVPGVWMWDGLSYRWRPGYWARVQPGYVWVADHYRWTPSGCIHVAGYWDLALDRRGVLYAPVVINPVVLTPRFVFTPVFAVSMPVMIDALFVRPRYCHYYFGDYYGPAYAGLGFQSYVVFGRAGYDPFFVYERWGHRAQPNWVSLQIDLYHGRSGGHIPCPPRTLVQQNIFVQKNVINVTRVSSYTMVAPAHQVAVAQGIRTVTVDTTTRMQARTQAVALHQVAVQRTQTERPLPPGAPRQARSASLSVPTPQAVHPGFTPAQVTSQAAAHAQGPQTFHAPPTPAHAPGTPGMAPPIGGQPHPAAGHALPVRPEPHRPAAPAHRPPAREHHERSH